MELDTPLALLLLIPAAALTLAALRGSALGLSGGRRRLSTGLRLALVACLVAVAAGARLSLPSEERAVVFALDVSESVGPAQRRHLLEWAQRSWESGRGGDAAGLVVFGREARLELPVGPVFAPREPTLERLGRDRTALDRALRLAGDLLRGRPEEGHVVLLSDGNGDAEAASREARALRSAGLRLHTVAVELTPAPGEVLIGGVSAPGVVSQGEPFLLDVEVVARSAGPAVLHVVRDGRYTAPHAVDLVPGVNHVAVPQRLVDADVHVYEVTVEAPGDGNPANDAGGALVRVRGRPKVLAVIGPDLGGEQDAVARSGPEAGEPVRQALVAAGFDVDLRGPEGLPLGAEELAGYAAVVFGNVAAERWAPAQMHAVRRWVFDQGGGLVALGGERSFGQGGYWRTPVEEALPVSSDVRAKKVLPSMALVFCVDRSGSMGQQVGELSKLHLAKEGVARSIELLQPFDYVGVIGFDHDAKEVVGLVQVEDPAPIKARVRAMQPDGGTALLPALTAAWRALDRVQAQVRHVVMLTDGQSGESLFELRALADDFRRAGITLSTVGLGQEVDQPTLELLAERAGGRFLWTDDPHTVPRLLSQEAITASRALLVERPFVPRHLGPLAALGIDWAAAPPLHGFVLTVPKPGAEVLLDTGPDDGPDDGPILVRWRYGLGRAAAFTSDATARWSADWLEWSGYPAVLGGVVRWAARPPEAPGFSTSLTVDQGRAEVRVRAEGPEGRPVNGLSLLARITGPPGASLPGEVALQQVAAGDYRAQLDAPRPGAYFATAVARAATSEGGEQAVGSAGAVLAYPAEYRHLTTDRALLERLADLGGGEAWTVDDPPAALLGGEREARVRLRSLAPTLLVAAALLLLLEVAARRLVLPERLRAALTRWRERRRSSAPRPSEAAATIGTLRERKREEREAALASRSARLARPSSTRAPAAVVEPEPAPTPAPPAPRAKEEAQPAAKEKEESEQPSGAVARLLAAKRQARGERKR